MVLMQTSVASGPRPKRPYVVAVVLGTALSAFAPAPAAHAETSAATLDAIADMGRYCTACWRNARLPADAWSDCTQEVFRRLLERVPADAWDRVLAREGDEHREFVRAIDAVKKRTQRARKWSAGLDGVADPRDGSARSLREDREAVRRAAADLLSPRQQRILQLSFEGWSVHDLARELNLPAERVSDEKYKGIRKLRSHLAENHQQS
jgi:RNA polymerase sigma factor (sigma-70 family)